jgi:hypothetical protein
MSRRELGVVTLLAALLGCGGASSAPADAAVGASSCVRVTTSPTCASPVPSYSATIHELLVSTCANCHYPGSGRAQSSLTTYDDVQLVYGSALGQVSACLMPPPDNPSLTEAQRAELIDWLACGAPDN